MLRWLPFVLLLSSSVAGACEVSGKRATLRAHVVPDRRAAFDVQVSAGPAKVRYDAVPMVIVATPIALTAPLTAPTNAMIAKRIELDGMVTLPTGTELLLRGAASPTSVDARLELVDLTFEHLAVPCAALALDHLDGGSYVHHDRVESKAVVPKSRYVVFRRKAGASTGLPAVLDDPVDFVMRVVARRDDWVQVTWSGPENVSLKAWLRASEVEAAQGETEGEGAPSPPSRWTHSDMRCARDEAPRASIDRGAPVHAVVGGTAWGRIAAPTGYSVKLLPDAPEWVAILRADSLSGPSCKDLVHAWVPRSSVHLPVAPQ
ncbi:MAG: hypothetical protein ABI321_05935 [Polyangia bacterium]